MTSIEAKEHLDEARRYLAQADDQRLDPQTAKAVGALIIAIDQVVEVVRDLASREQGKVIA